MPDTTTGPTTDPITDRLLRHMAWANAALIKGLSGLPDEALALAAPRNEWHVARILDHLVNAAGGYATRLDGGVRLEAPELLTSTTQLAERAARCAGFDARLRAHATLPEGLASYEGDTDNAHARSTVISQAIHHATEHRAQIAGALATNGIDAIDLDALDLWEFAEA
ncbi:MAG: DinB family protein, partial [Chloroflexota bacterium]